MDDPRTISQDLRRFDSAAVDRRGKLARRPCRVSGNDLSDCVAFRIWDEKAFKRRFRHTNSIQTTEDASENKMPALRSQRELASTILTSNEDSAAGHQREGNPQEQSMNVEQTLGAKHHGRQVLIKKDNARAHEVGSSVT